MAVDVLSLVRMLVKLVEELVMEVQWTIEEAEKKLPELINRATQGEPQFIYSKGCAQAVLISAKEWRNKIVEELPEDPALSAQADERVNDVGCRPAKSFVEALLAMPQGDWDLEPCADALKMRDIDL